MPLHDSGLLGTVGMRYWADDRDQKKRQRTAVIRMEQFYYTHSGRDRSDRARRREQVS